LGNWAAKEEKKEKKRPIADFLTSSLPFGRVENMWLHE